MRNAHLSVLAAIALAAISAACGGASPAAPPAASPSPASAPAPSGVPGTGGAATFGDESFRGPMKPIVTTSMVGDLKELGLDPAALPPMDQLGPEVLRKVMKTFSKALGARCDACHVSGDFAAPTQRKAVALGMWNHFVRELATKEGGPVYCDSCHQGSLTPLLDRHDDKLLSHYMQDNYVKPLSRRDGKTHDCATCHGDPFDGHFLKAWAGGAGSAGAAPSR